jgi:hypothetical protein
VTTSQLKEWNASGTLSRRGKRLLIAVRYGGHASNGNSTDCHDLEPPGLSGMHMEIQFLNDHGRPLPKTLR